MYLCNTVAQAEGNLIEHAESLCVLTRLFEGLFVDIRRDGTFANLILDKIYRHICVICAYVKGDGTLSHH